MVCAATKTEYAVLNGAAAPVDALGPASARSPVGAMVHVLVEHRSGARVALLTLVVNGLVYAPPTGEPQQSAPLDGGAFAAGPMIVALPAVTIRLLLTQRASRWFRR